MLFRRRERRGGAPAGYPVSSASGQGCPQFYTIDFDMMLKGSVYKRGKTTIRQFGVTVNGATRLVTSGDTVDRGTYEALVAAAAIRPIPGASEKTPAQRAPKRTIPDNAGKP